VTSDPRTVLIVDDDASIRATLTDLFESVGLQVAAFASAQEFAQWRRVDAPVCLVLDIRMPGKSGLEFQRDLNAANIRVPVIFLTGHGDIPMSVRAMKDGAMEFLTKPVREQELLDAVHIALERDAANRADEKFVAHLRYLFETLTPRERTVMRLVVAGQMGKQIANAIAVSEATAKVHLAKVMKKMEASSLAQLIDAARRLGIDGTSG
jgi:FixJ family two-component response regulator